MQPDQPNQQSQTGTNTPDFFQLDQTPSRPSKSPKKLIAIVVGLLVFVAVIAAGAWYMTWLQGEPERRLYRAIDNMMRTSYVAREYEFTRENTEEGATIEAMSDFSDPSKPKSMATFFYPNPLEESKARDSVLEGDVVFSGDDTFVQLRNSPVNTPELNKWHPLPDETIESLNFSELEFITNNPLDRLVTGNFTEIVRTKLLQFAKQNAIYKIKKSSEVKLSGTNTTMYTIETSRNSYVLFNNKAAEFAEIESPYVPPYSKNNKLDIRIWVNNATDKITKLSYIIKSGDDETETTIKYNYPNKINIETPDAPEGS